MPARMRASVPRVRWSSPARGGLALLAGLLLMGVAAAGLGGGDVFTANLAEILSVHELNAHPWYTAFAVLIFIGCFTKSAQFPFHFWLPGAMTAPTPASAFLHSATMVKAGIYLLARVYPVMGENVLFAQVVVTVGLLTLFISSVFAIQQRDLKGLLAYTTTAQLGLIVAMLGVPEHHGFEAAMFGILVHALYKAALFMTVGTIDHSTGTRIIDELGGLWKHMPVTGVIVIISALSMAGMPPLFGFVAKEMFLHTVQDYLPFTTFLLVIGVIAAALTGTAGYIYIWDVFFKKPTKEIHFHAPPRAINYGPGVLAIGSLTFGFLLNPVVVPFLNPSIPEDIHPHLFPSSLTPVFLMSLTAIGLGLLMFLIRNLWLQVGDLLPFNGQQAYAAVIRGVEWTGDQLLKSQNGRIRFYMVVIFGSVAGILLASGLLIDLAQTGNLLSNLGPPRVDFTIALRVLFLGLGMASVLATVFVKKHLFAALALGVFGYSVAGLFLIEPAPDVALVAFLVETLGTVLVIMMLGRTSQKQRHIAAERLWKTRSGVGVWRDAIVASIIGFCIFVFALTAFTNRPERESIAAWHIANTDAELHIPDIVSGIVTDFRGMDTLFEINVFATAALGVLALLSINRMGQGAEEPAEPAPAVQENSLISTPLTQVVAYVALPIAVIVALTELLYGAAGPGDGFTAGAVLGLAVALQYIVFGYHNIHERLKWLNPLPFLTGGLLLALANAFFPLLVGQNVLAHVVFTDLHFGGLEFVSTVVFEISIALTVFGSIGVLMETISHPRDVQALQEAEPQVEPNLVTREIPVARRMDPDMEPAGD